MRYGKNTTKAIDTITFRIGEGRKLGILGPNGAGKTTLISCLCGLLAPTKGKINYINNGTNQNVSQIRNKIGLVPQEYAFYDNLTARQNLQYFAVLYKLDKATYVSQAATLLPLLGLDNVSEKKVKHFSGGMKRRLNLAIGLVHKPDILFLDEPTVGIDVQSKNAIISFLNTLNQKGVTIVYTSHYLSEAQRFCNDVVLLDHGKILVDSQMDALIKANQHKDLQDIFINLTGGALRDEYV